MKLASISSVLALGTLSLGASLQAPLASKSGEPEANAGKFLIELAPGETRWVTEKEKWDLKLVSCSSNVESVQRSPDTVPSLASRQLL